MTQALQSYISAFAQLMLASSFGLAVAISVAGVSHLDNPLGCRLCKPVAQLGLDDRA